MGVPRAVAVVVDGDRALLIKRYRKRDSARGCAICRDSAWPGPDCPGHHYAVLPGGHVEAGESTETAARRELLEETTLQAEIDRLLWTGRHNDRPATYYLMTAVLGTPQLSGEEAQEHEPNNSFELMWATANDFEPLNLIPHDIRGPLAQLLGH